MADNITAPAFGAALATDEIGSVHYPRTKIGHGADGTYADASAAPAAGATAQEAATSQATAGSTMPERSPTA